MQVDRNSVWTVTHMGGIEDGLYRALTHSPDGTLLVLFNLDNTKGLERPTIVEISAFIQSFKYGNVKNATFQLPFYQLIAEEEIPSKYLALRDHRYRLIQELVDTPDFLLEITLTQRSSSIIDHAKKNGTYVQNMYRLLNLFWKYGQDRNALLPAFKLCGGVGKTRPTKSIKRGRRIEFQTPTIQISQGVNTADEDKKKFLLAMKKYGLNGHKVTYSYVYKMLLMDFYTDELVAAEREDRDAEIPSYRAFLYWCKKLISKSDLARKQTTSGDFERNKRALRGKATDHTEVPGSCFELDSTVLDVHVVSEFRRNHVLGRPTVYCVVDKESRMIVGIHVSMEYASWLAGRQALVNSFTAKKDYCARFDVKIEEDEWPCHHVPQRLLCDRGEFICNRAEKLAVPLIGHLSIAPPYRADLKGIVEHRFHILNEKLVHELMGTTKGRHYIRGDRDPRLDACLTLKEVTTLLIDAVLDHNSSIFKDLAGQTTLLLEAGLAATPINYWNIHTEKQRHALNVVDEVVVRSKLIPPTQVTMTALGVCLNQHMYYECQRPEFEDWKSIARLNKSWRVEALIDQDNSSFIYVRFNETEEFIRCSLIYSASHFEHRHAADVQFHKDWNAAEKKRNVPTIKNIERNKRKEAITENAKREFKNAPPLATKTAGYKDMKERRKTETLMKKITVDDSPYFDNVKEKESADGIIEQRKSQVINLLSRVKRLKN